MNRIQADLKKGIFAEGEKAWDKHKTKLGMKTAKPDETPASQVPTQPASTPPPPPAAAPSAAPVSSNPAPPSVPAPAAGAPPPPAAPAAPEHPDEQPAPTPTNSTVEPPPEAAPQEKQNFKGKLKEKLLAKLSDPTVQDKAEQALKKEAKKKFFGFKF